MALLEAWWSAGFEARIVVAREGVVDRSYLGRVLDRATAVELAAAGVDACGENGEFHTVVTGRPAASRPAEAQTARAGAAQWVLVPGRGGPLVH